MSLPLKSTEWKLDVIRQLEESADELSIELDGTVNVVQSKNGVQLIKDELPSELIIQALKYFIEEAVKEYGKKSSNS